MDDAPHPPGRSRLRRLMKHPYTLLTVLFCAAMIVGRMEALVIIALFNPIYWRQ